jgi:hypothetical protein
MYNYSIIQFTIQKKSETKSRTGLGEVQSRSASDLKPWRAMSEWRRKEFWKKKRMFDVVMMM